MNQLQSNDRQEALLKIDILDTNDREEEEEEEEEENEEGRVWLWRYQLKRSWMMI